MGINSDRWRIEDGKIVKVSNGQPIPDDEPIFILRARDRLAVAALSHYIELAEGDGCNDYLLDSVREMLGRFQDFAWNNPQKMKQPGVTRGK